MSVKIPLKASKRLRGSGVYFGFKLFEAHESEIIARLVDQFVSDYLNRTLQATVKEGIR